MNNEKAKEALARAIDVLPKQDLLDEFIAEEKCPGDYDLEHPMCTVTELTPAIEAFRRCRKCWLIATGTDEETADWMVEHWAGGFDE